MTESSQRKISISELVELASTTSELSATEPKISEPETEPATSEPTLEFITPTPSHPYSPWVKFRIPENLPLGLFSIEEITDTEGEDILPLDQESLDIRPSESIYYYSPFK